MQNSVGNLKRNSQKLEIWRNGLVYFIALVPVILISIIWTSTNDRIALEKQIAIENSINDSKNIALIVSANLEKILDRSLLYANISASYLEGNHTTTPFLNPALVGDASYLRLAIFGQSGTLLYSSAARQREPELQSLVDETLRQEVKLGIPPIIIGKPGTENAVWRVPVLISLPSDAKEKTGFFAAIVDFGYFLRLYEDVNMGGSGRIEIFNQEGIQLAEWNGTSISSGANIIDSHFGKFLLLPDEVGPIDAPRPDAPENSIGVFKKVGAYPLKIAVTRDRANILTSTVERHRTYYFNSMIVTAAVLLLFGGLALLIKRQQNTFTVLAQSEEEKHTLIQELEQEKSRAYQLASHDYLTDIPNRMLFHELARSELSRAKRSRNLYALLFLDLNKFKSINDTLGHAVGDLLLKAVAQRLRKAVRAYDIVARLGGDEFVIMLSEISSEQRVAEIAAMLVDVISAPYADLDGNYVEVGTSIGIALFPRDGQNVEALLTRADSAMYSAKANGAGNYRFCDASLNASTARQFELLARFRAALKENEFCLHYQPRVNLKNFEIVGLEALVRWQHPTDGMIFPGEFINLAEKHNLIVALGEWVINETCRQMASWKEAGIPVVPVAINVSAKQLKDESLLTMICNALERYSLESSLLEIEITESCLIEDFDTAKSVLERLRDYGLKISMDDYGTGFSGLSSLKQLPIYAIKIDRSFVRDIRNDVSDAVIVASTITLAHNLGLIVVAEGVESKEQVVHLKTAGCDQVQGFYFKRPVSADEIELVLKRRTFHLELA